MRTVKVVIWARDEMIEAFLHRQVGTLQRIKVVDRGTSDAQGAILDANLLTPSEKRVLRAFTRHDRIDEVALELHITRNTVKKHLGRIYGKLGVRSVHRASWRAKEWGLLSGDEGGEEYPIG